MSRCHASWPPLPHPRCHLAVPCGTPQVHIPHEDTHGEELLKSKRFNFRFGIFLPFVVSVLCFPVSLSVAIYVFLGLGLQTLPFRIPPLSEVFPENLEWWKSFKVGRGVILVSQSHHYWTLVTHVTLSYSYFPVPLHKHRTCNPYPVHVDRPSSLTYTQWSCQCV